MRYLKYFAYFLLSLGLLLFIYLKATNSTLADVGLTALSWVKSIEGDAVDLDALPQVERPAIDHQPWTDLVRQFVAEDGMVDYPGFLEESGSLQDYLDLLADNPPGTNWTEEETLAYWINAYNAFTVKLIIDHYPLESIKDISGGGGIVASPWDLKFFQIGGVDFDLGTIEHEIIRKDFSEPRIHFAINCASISCPVLRREAFEADRLDQQLNDQARQFLQDSSKNQVSARETKLSKIFSWFQSDFNRNVPLLTYLQQFAPDLDPNNSVTYLEYDWGLNED
ncbi:MAG: DUF547 domain-containing protein [Bacteroidota bacterium]